MYGNRFKKQNKISLYMPFQKLYTIKGKRRKCTPSMSSWIFQYPRNSPGDSLSNLFNSCTKKVKRDPSQTQKNPRSPVLVNITPIHHHFSTSILSAFLRFVGRERLSLILGVPVVFGNRDVGLRVWVGSICGGRYARYLYDAEP